MWCARTLRWKNKRTIPEAEVFWTRFKSRPLLFKTESWVKWFKFTLAHCTSIALLWFLKHALSSNVWNQGVNRSARLQNRRIQRRRAHLKGRNMTRLSPGGFRDIMHSTLISAAWSLATVNSATQLGEITQREVMRPHSKVCHHLSFKIPTGKFLFAMDLIKDRLL